jgi:hypothetical protein
MEEKKAQARAYEKEARQAAAAARKQEKDKLLADMTPEQQKAHRDELIQKREQVCVWAGKGGAGCVVVLAGSAAGRRLGRWRTRWQRRCGLCAAVCSLRHSD